MRLTLSLHKKTNERENIPEAITFPSLDFSTASMTGLEGSFSIRLSYDTARRREVVWKDGARRATCVPGTTKACDTKLCKVRSASDHRKQRRRSIITVFIIVERRTILHTLVWAMTKIRMYHCILSLHSFVAKCPLSRISGFLMRGATSTIDQT